METLAQDARYALRTLAKRPGFTAVVVLTLALGLGANAAVFSVVEAVLIRHLPFDRPGDLVTVWERKPDQGWEHNVVAPANFVDWKAEARSFEGLAGVWARALNLGGLEEPEEVRVAIASAELFQMLGVPAAVGRLFDPSDVESRRFADVVVLSHAYWLSRFGGDPGVIGSTVTLNGSSNTVIGVVAPQARLLEPGAKVWLPTSFRGADRVNEGRYIRVVGRLAPGVGLEQARAEMTEIARRLEDAHPSFNTGWGVSLVPLHEELAGDVRPALLLLLGAVGLLLLVACTNVANLMLARAAGRRREIAVRAALGAGSGRIFRQLATESLILVTAAGSLGLFLAVQGTGTLLGLLPESLRLPQIEDVRLDGAVLAFTAALTLLAGLVFGLVPVVGAWTAQLAQSLREGRGESGSARHRVLRSGLVVAEIALALVLVVGAGLLFRSFTELRRVDTGLEDPAHVLTARVTLSGQRYREPNARQAFFRDVQERIEAVPGVESASAIQWLPLSGESSGTLFYPEDKARPPVGQEPSTDVRVVLPGYFETVGMPLVAGRTLDGRDRAESPAVAIVNETLARRHWPGENPVGKRLSYSWGDWISVEVVGVVGDVRHHGADQEVQPAIFRPHAQDLGPWMNLVIRSSVEPSSLVPSVARAVHEVDSQLPVANFRTLGDYHASALAEPRLNMLLIAAFSVLALVLAAVGVYGVISYSVTQRRREIGIRMALGAERGSILALVVRHGLGLAVLGIVLGTAGAYALTRLLDSLLFGVSATDPVTFASVPVVLLATAACASFLPARRASRVDPTVTLRYE